MGDSANFFNELYSIHFDGERATWSLINYTGKKEEKSKVEENVDEVKKMEDMSIETSDTQPEEPKTLTVESGAFTVSSTIGLQEKEEKKASGVKLVDNVNVPTPRFN